MCRVLSPFDIFTIALVLFKYSGRIAFGKVYSLAAGIRPLAPIRFPIGNGSQNLASFVVKDRLRSVQTLVVCWAGPEQVILRRDLPTRPRDWRIDYPPCPLTGFKFPATGIERLGEPNHRLPVQENMRLA